MMWLELSQNKTPIFINFSLVVSVQDDANGSGSTIKIAAGHDPVTVDQSAEVVMSALATAQAKFPSQYLLKSVP